MDSGFDKLEAYIGRAMDRIAVLQEERDKLLLRRRELESRMEELQEQNLRLQEEVETIRASSVDRSELEARKKEIEERVQRLLTRFESLEQEDAAAAAES